MPLKHHTIPDPGHNPFTKVRVRLDCRLMRTVAWEVRESFQDRDGVFRVERSEENGPFTPVADNIDGLAVDVEGIRGMEPDRLTWWRVVLKGRMGEYPSEPVQEGNWPWHQEDILYANNIFRREYMTMVRYSGVPGTILHPRRSGQPCPVCSMDGIRSAGRSNCQYCDGIGLVGGYYPGEDLVVMLLGASNPTRDVNPALGAVSPGQSVKARCPATTLINDGDVWVNSLTGDRYLIEALVPDVVYKDFVITHSLQMERLDASHLNAINTPSVLGKLPSARSGNPRINIDDLN